MGLQDGQDITAARSAPTRTAAVRPVGKRSTPVAQRFRTPTTAPVLTPPAFDHSPAGRAIIDAYQKPATSNTSPSPSGGYDAPSSGGGSGSAADGSSGDTNGDGEITAEDQTDMGDDTLNATLAAIEAEFGMTKQQLLNDQGEAGRQYRQIIAGMQMQRRNDLEAVRDDLVQRGILRSGETLENETKLQRGYAQNVAAAQGDRDLQLANAAAQLAALGPQEAAAKATATSEHERAVLDYETMKALSGGGL